MPQRPLRTACLKLPATPSRASSQASRPPEYLPNRLSAGSLPLPEICRNAYPTCADAWSFCISSDDDSDLLMQVAISRRRPHRMQPLQ